MRHLGDINKINGAEIEPVDIITFGSPCQDLSVAGKRTGLNGQRSGLFMEAIRIIKEMREATNDTYPRYAVWENVPGAFSSNKGQDFRNVLEELIKIVEPDAVMPDVPKKGWAYADSYRGNGWSLAYRVLDAQYWGVPQRRRRIYLVADFRGQSAGKILFEREGLRGYFTEGRAPWQGVATNIEGSVGTDDKCYGVTTKGNGDAFISFERHTSLSVGGGQAGQGYPCVMQPTFILDNIGGQTEYGKASQVNGTLRAGIKGAVAYEWHNQDSRITGPIDVGYTLSTNAGGREGHLVLETITLEGNGQRPSHHGDGYIVSDKSYTLNATEVHGVVYALDRASFNQGENAQYNFEITDSGVNSTIVAKGPSAVCLETFHCTTEDNKSQPLKARDYKDPLTVVLGEKPRYIVRRLTPTECARLQGFPDTWGHIEPKSEFTDEEYMFWLEVRNNHAAVNGRRTKDYTKKQMLAWYNKLHSDSAEYKLWGNGIALPCALYVMQGIANTLKEGK